MLVGNAHKEAVRLAFVKRAFTRAAQLPQTSAVHADTAVVGTLYAPAQLHNLTTYVEVPEERSKGYGLKDGPENTDFIDDLEPSHKAVEAGRAVAHDKRGTKVPRRIQAGPSEPAIVIQEALL